MKIAIIGTRGIPAKYGGFETNVQHTAPFLAKNGIDVTVYCRYIKKGFKPKKYQGVNLVYIKTISAKKFSTLWHTLKSLVHASLSNYDLIHIYNVGNGPLLFIPKIFKKQVVVSVDGMDWKRKKYNFIEKKLVLICAKLTTIFANKIIVDSKHVGQFYKNKFKIKPKYIPYGANVIKKSPPKNILKKLKLTPQKYFVFVGRFVPEKNIPILIQAFKKAKIKGFKLVLVGRAINSKYQAKLDKLKTKNIIMPGLIFDQDAETLYRNSCAYVTASELEGTSPSLLQAMGAKTCVVFNSIEENLETVENAGLNYKYNDFKSLASILKNLSSDQKLRDDLAQKAQKRIIKNYTWDKINQEYLNFILSFK